MKVNVPWYDLLDGQVPMLDLELLLRNQHWTKSGNLIFQVPTTAARRSKNRRRNPKVRLPPTNLVPEANPAATKLFFRPKIQFFVFSLPLGFNLPHFLHLNEINESVSGRISCFLALPLPSAFWSTGTTCVVSLQVTLLMWWFTNGLLRSIFVNWMRVSTLMARQAFCGKPHWYLGSDLTSLSRLRYRLPAVGPHV